MSRFSSSLVRNGGATLLEVITVAAVIGLLACLMIPVMKSISERGQETKCINHLRQIGTTVQLYAADHNANLPPGSDDSVKWFNLSQSWLGTYGGRDSKEALKPILRCPVDKTVSSYQYYYSYSWNGEQLLAYVNGAPANNRVPVKLAKAQDKILFADGLSNAESASVATYPAQLSVPLAAARLSSRHRGGPNCLLGDGSVRWLLISDAAQKSLIERLE